MTTNFKELLDLSLKEFANLDLIDLQKINKHLDNLIHVRKETLSTIFENRDYNKLLAFHSKFPNDHIHVRTDFHSEKYYAHELPFIQKILEIYAYDETKYNSLKKNFLYDSREITINTTLESRTGLLYNALTSLDNFKAVKKYFPTELDEFYKDILDWHFRLISPEVFSSLIAYDNSYISDKTLKTAIQYNYEGFYTIVENDKIKPLFETREFRQKILISCAINADFFNYLLKKEEFGTLMNPEVIEKCFLKAKTTENISTLNLLIENYGVIPNFQELLKPDQLYIFCSNNTDYFSFILKYVEIKKHNIPDIAKHLLKKNYKKENLIVFLDTIKGDNLLYDAFEHNLNKHRQSYKDVYEEAYKILNTLKLKNSLEQNLPSGQDNQRKNKI